MASLMAFFAGLFLCNALPHLIAGVQGAPFPTPFAKPRGVGELPPLVNFWWGAFNLAIGLGLLAQHPFALGTNLDCAGFASGALAMGSFCAHHFGGVRAGKR